MQIGRRANPAETVTQLVYEVPKHLKPALLLHLLRDPQMDMVLVFSRMKHGADRIARHLEQQGIRTATLHSNRSQNQRLRALKDFKSGAVRVLVATDIAARGIDVDGISHVVNYDFPMHSEDYVHRIGRTGRAHAVGDAISFVTPEDQGELRALERFIGRGIVRKRAEGFNYSRRRAGPHAKTAAATDIHNGPKVISRDRAAGRNIAAGVVRTADISADGKRKNINSLPDKPNSCVLSPAPRNRRPGSCSLRRGRPQKHKFAQICHQATALIPFSGAKWCCPDC